MADPEEGRPPTVGRESPPGAPGRSGSTESEPTAPGAPGPPTDRGTLRAEVRQDTVDALCEAFAEDRLAVEEFERRLDAVHTATSEAELRQLLADLPSPTPPVRGGGAPGRVQDGPARARTTVPGRRPGVGADQVRDQSIILGIMGGGGRSGPWTPARTNWAMGIMGGAEVDFREARMPPGVTEVKVVALLGGVEIIVPPDVRVDCSGVGIMGGFDETHTTESTTDPEAPLLRVSGVAIMGGFAVTVRHPGESARDARQRRKEERKTRRRLRSGREDG